MFETYIYTVKIYIDKFKDTSTEINQNVNNISIPIKLVLCNILHIHNGCPYIKYK